MSEEQRETDHIVIPTRENYRRRKEQLLEGKRKIEEMEKKEHVLFEMFSMLFYENADSENVKKVSNSFSGYTVEELEDMYPRLQYLAPWKDKEDKTKFITGPGRRALSFLMIYLVADLIAMMFLSFFVWHVMGNFLYVLYSAGISAGLLAAMIAIKGVIKYVRKKEE